jgi:hypothetical protein
MPRTDGRHRQPLHSADGIQKYLCRHMSLARLRLPKFHAVLTEPPRSSPCIQRRHVGEHVVQPVTVWWRLCCIPRFGSRELAVKPTFRFRLVIHTVEANNALEEDVKFGVG